MSQAQLLAHFDRLGEAPDAIPRLRRFVLDLAVRGKLVEQDPDDEPASELLKRIQAEKARLVRAGEINEGKPLPPVTKDGLPFRIPENWRWSQLAEIGFLNPRNTANDALQTSFVPMPLISSTYGVASRHEIRSWGEIKSGYTHFAEGDVALAKITPCFQNGKSTVFRGLVGGMGAGTTELHVVRPVRVCADYVLIFLKCPHFIESGIPKMTGTAGQKRVPTEYFAYSPFPLPPLAEQQRIVAKVDELMALCDRLEAAKAERESRRDRLVAALLHHLNQPAVDATTFRQHARFYLSHLPRLATRPEHVKQLRQTILNLAVRGRLVPQDPNDEPASELLKRIQAEKARLMKEGEVNKLEVFEPVGANEIRFPIPSCWVAVRMGFIARKLGAGSTPLGGKSVYQSKGVPFLRSQNVHNDSLRLDDVAFISRAIHDRMSGTHVLPEDILLNITGASIGRCALVPSTLAEGNVSQHVAIIRLFLPAIREFIHLSLTSPFFQKVIDDVQVGVSREGLSMQRLRLFPMLLPPFAEQYRIVAKVDELMALCDQLEAQLTAAQTESRRLLEAILHEALDGGAQEA